MPKLPEEITQPIEKKMRGRLESNADYQHRRFQMTREERARDAKDRLTKNVHEHMQQQTGGKSTYSDAERKVEALTRRFVNECEK